MKILKNSTYRGLKADEKNLAIMVEENKRLNTAVDYWQTVSEILNVRNAELEVKLSKFSRKRDPETGKFTAPAEA